MRRFCGNKSAWLAVSAGLVLVSLAVSPAASAATLSCGAVVSTDTVLQNDLIGCAGNGITIVADADVTLDLNGHRISGTGGDVGIAATVANGFTATVENGFVTGFGVGVSAGSSELPFAGSIAVRRVSAIGNGTGFRFSEIHVLVADSQALFNADSGISTGGNSPVRLERNKVKHNGGNGIATPFSEPARIADNQVTENGGIGIYTTDATTSLIGNVASRNGSHGIFVTDDYGIFFPYLFQDNVANSNGGFGIYFSGVLSGPNGETVDGGGNSAKHNAGPAQCFSIVCSKK